MSIPTFQRKTLEFTGFCVSKIESKRGFCDYVSIMVHVPVPSCVLKFIRVNAGIISFLRAGFKRPIRKSQEKPENIIYFGPGSLP